MGASPPPSRTITIVSTTTAKPRVAIIQPRLDTRSSRKNGRTTTRSSKAATRVVMAMTRGRSTTWGSWCRSSSQNELIMPTITRSPWARLNTLVVL